MPLLTGGTSYDETPSFGTGTSAGLGLGPLQANANLGLFQIPISASFLNPSATTTFDPTTYANPTVTQGALSNSLILGPQFGGGQSSSASLFGGGGGEGGGGGNVVDNINYSPTTDLTQNLPPVPGFAPMSNMLQGGASQNVMTPFRPLPMPNPNSAMGMMMNTTQPIAAGGISPTMAAILAGPQQQLMAPPGQQIIPGSASYAGGYDQPPAPMPQSGGMPQMPMGGANAMGIPMMGGGMGMPQMSPANMPGNVMSRSGPVPFNQVTASGLQPQQATADYSRTGDFPPFTPGKLITDANGKKHWAQPPMQAGSQRAVGPSAPVSSDFQDYMDQAQQILDKLPSDTEGPISDFKSAAADFIDDHKTKDHLLRKNHDAASLGVLSHYVDQAINKTTQAQAARREDAAKKLFATKYDTDAAGNKVMSEEQKSILRGSSPQARGSVHPKWRMAGNIAEMALGNTGIGKAIRTVDKAGETAAEKRAVIDRENFGRFVTQLDNMIGSMDKAESGQGEDARALQTDTREQMDHNDTQLNNNLSNAYKQIIEPAKFQVEGDKAQLGALSDQGKLRGEGIKEANQPFENAIQAGNLQAHQLSAASSAANAALGRQKFGWDQAKDARDNPGVRSARAQKETLDLISAIKSASDQGLPVEYKAPLKIQLAQKLGQLPANYSIQQLQQVAERVKSGKVKPEALAARGIDFKTLQDAYK